MTKYKKEVCSLTEGGAKVVDGLGNGGPLSDEDVFRIYKEAMERKRNSEQPKVEIPAKKSEKPAQVYASPKAEEKKTAEKSSQTNQVSSNASEKNNIDGLLDEVFNGSGAIIGHKNPAELNQFMRIASGSERLKFAIHNKGWCMLKEGGFIEIYGSGHAKYLVFRNEREGSFGKRYKGTIAKVDYDRDLTFNLNGSTVHPVDMGLEDFLDYMNNKKDFDLRK